MIEEIERVLAWIGVATIVYIILKVIL